MPPVVLKDKIRDFVYRISMREAVLRGSYDNTKEWLWKDLSLFPRSKRALRTLLDNVVSARYTSQTNYDTDFLNTCIIICDEINNQANKKCFTFGNAQKFINLYVKFFYVSTYFSANPVYFQYCHCPMDSVLLKSIWKKSKGDFKNLKIRRLEFLKSWGNEDFDIINGVITMPKRYIAFQDAVRKQCLGITESVTSRTIYPLELDYCEW